MTFLWVNNTFNIPHVTTWNSDRTIKFPSIIAFINSVVQFHIEIHLLRTYIHSYTYNIHYVFRIVRSRIAQQFFFLSKTPCGLWIYLAIFVAYCFLISTFFFSFGWLSDNAIQHHSQLLTEKWFSIWTAI